MACRKPRAQRRGVVLLLALALLAVFGVVVLAFVVVTGFARRGAETAKLHQVQYDPPENTVMQAALQVIRGSNNPASAIWCHSLLEDLYGEKLVEGRLTNTSQLVPLAGGQLWGFQPSFSNPHLLVGCSLTFLTGALAGVTTRIVDYDAVNNRLIIVAPDNVSITSIQNDLQTRDIHYLVNGRPFSGTGVGFSGGTNLDYLDAKPVDFNIQEVFNWMPYALTPNGSTRSFFQYGQNRLLLANEDYDAADYQNMFLAMVVTHPGTGEILVPEPSFHRVALIAYWFNQAIFGNFINWGPVNNFEERFNYLLRPETIPDPQLRREVALFERKFILRPLRSFHPNFDGSNPTYQPGLAFIDTNNDGQPDRLVSENPALWNWDVDNDGDGVPDSIWVDIGLPVRQLPDGRRYKPLAAILCVDLDGRLNLNAHGSLLQADSRYYQADDLAQDGVVSPSAPVHPDLIWLLAAGRDVNNDSFPDGELPAYLYPAPPNSPNGMRHWFRGLGFGPAEINLGPLFQLLFGPSWQGHYQSLFLGRLDQNLGLIMGRYGERTRFASPPPAPAAGLAGQGDALLANKFFTFPLDWRTTLRSPYGSGVPTLYGSPPDMMGAMCVGLDLRGRPMYVQPQPVWSAAVTDNPYKINLSPRGGRGFIQSGQQDLVDAPFTPSELEAVLRPFDPDSKNLPQRLQQLIPDLVRVRHMITTESWHIPVTPLAGSARWRQQFGNFPESIVQRFNLPSPEHLWIMFSPDVLAGLPLDINRPLGDGLDNNNNGVVDEPAEAISGLDTWAYQTASGPGPAVPFDYDGDGVPGGHEDPRQALARHLYVLMMATADLNYLDGITGSRLQTARMIAQWAVNVVDFRDRDSIMTRFVFDEDPFNGWHEPNPSDPQYVQKLQERTVWGCERPELLITETLAFHDRRTEDLGAYGHTENDPMEKDYPTQNQGITDLDQRYRPQGSLFVELYNPWFETEPPPAEFDDPGKPSPEPRPGIDLAKTNPAGQPIWRLVITRADTDPNAPGLARDPDDPLPENRPQIERAVYFIPRPTGGFPEEGSIKVCYYPSNNYAGEIDEILPGRYAVIGPAGRPDGDITYIGFQLEQGTTGRYIQILRHQVIVDKNGDTTPLGIQPPVGIRIDRGYVASLPADREIRLSVSEPTTGYEELEANQTDESGRPIQYNPNTGRYEDPPGTPQVIDQPLDAQRADLQPDEDWDHLFGHNTTRTAFRVVHLQRLANPTQAYDPYNNPYRTIDSAPVDLTCFNSRTTQEDFLADGTAPIAHTDDPVMFHTRQRGERNDDPPQPNNNNPSNLVITDTNRHYVLWKQEPLGKPVEDDRTPAPVGIFNRKLRHTLGYLSKYFGTPRSRQEPLHTYNGDPPRPFPWLTWLNRPYTSATELLLVPALPSSRLLAYDSGNYYKYYRVPRDGTNPEQDLNPYEPNPQAGPTDPAAAYDPYPHLLNYFWSVDIGADNSTAPEFHRVLNFVGVRSPFVDTELQLNPQAAQLISPVSAPHRFTPPNHMIPYWREPGRINLNTLYSPQAWAGLMNRLELIVDPPASWFDTSHPYVRLWHEFLDSRRAFYVDFKQALPQLPPSVPNGPPPFGPDSYLKLLQINPDYPTRFGNPFRSFGGLTNVPAVNPLYSNNPPLQELIKREVNATILREKVRMNDAFQKVEFTHVPLFQSPPTDPEDPEDPNAIRGLEYCDINRNPFFRYRDLMRLGNLVTTRSNVYAVWVTIGYFEVEPITQATVPPGLTPQEIAEIYPDGYMLGQELGSDSGDIRRHRGFFIVDRSLPVGFKRGQDLNVDKAILIKRILE